MELKELEFEIEETRDKLKRLYYMKDLKRREEKRQELKRHPKKYKDYLIKHRKHCKTWRDKNPEYLKNYRLIHKLKSSSQNKEEKK